MARERELPEREAAALAPRNLVAAHGYAIAIAAVVFLVVLGVLLWAAVFELPHAVMTGTGTGGGIEINRPGIAAAGPEHTASRSAAILAPTVHSSDCVTVRRTLRAGSLR